MKTYKEAIKKIAITEANLYYGGHMTTTDWDTRHTVAWIFEKTGEQVANDVKAISTAANEYVRTGKEF